MCRYTSRGETMSFRRLIQRAAKRQGLSGYAIARLCDGLSERSIQRYLRGTNDLSGEKVAKLASALGLELREKKKAK